MTGTYSPIVSISTSHRSHSDEHLMQTKLLKKYTWGRDWTVLHSVKNDNSEHHLRASSSSELATVRNFLATFLLEEVLPMLLQSLNEPPLTSLPQDSGDLSVGWRCFRNY